MARTQRKVIACIAASGLGIVLAANPSNAMPWGASLRPSFVHDVLDDHAVVAIGVSSSADPTIAPPPTTAPTAPTAATGLLSEPPPATLPTPPPTPAPTTPEPPATNVANVTAGDQAQPKPEPTEPTEPTEPPKPPTTVDRPEEHRPATLALSCEVTGGGAWATVACAWSGETPEGAVRLLVLRSDGRVRLTTEDTGRRRHVDNEVPAGRGLSYVVVFVDAGGHSIARSNSAAVTTPAAPPPTTPTTAAPQPPHTSEPSHPTTTALRPTEPPHPTTAAPRPIEPPHPTTTTAGEPRH